MNNSVVIPKALFDKLIAQRYNKGIPDNDLWVKVKHYLETEETFDDVLGYVIYHIADLM